MTGDPQLSKVQIAEPRRGLAALAQATRAVDMPPLEQAPPFVLAYGFFRSGVRMAQAAILLHDHGFTHETAPLCRSLSEFYTVIVWLADKGQEAADAFTDGHLESQSKLKSAVESGTWSDEVMDAVANLDLSGAVNGSENVLLHFAHRARSYGLERLVPPWIVNTRIAHPSVTGATYFYDEIQGEVILHQDPKPVTDLKGAMLGQCLEFVFRSAVALNSMMPSQPWTDLLSRSAQPLGLDISVPRRSSTTT